MSGKIISRRHSGCLVIERRTIGGEFWESIVRCHESTSIEGARRSMEGLPDDWEYRLIYEETITTREDVTE